MTLWDLLGYYHSSSSSENHIPSHSHQAEAVPDPCEGADHFDEPDDSLSPDSGHFCFKKLCAVAMSLLGSTVMQKLASTSTHMQQRCHGSIRDACPQGQPGVARPSDMSAKNIGRKECRESRRKHVDRSDGSGREYRRIGRTHQIMSRIHP